ncbi:hypothetical protein [Eoetvoesiella caeni]|uniref:Uncharacterized protein n=1 Tax=Eoetvoesiella caeni TaxID=645616 RepID=A0A366HAH4_9BURK|nr:hypothetical protein [Eoetvoesiella caeni]MCI2809361.1 hypothetical protein [Eoetvoesiella caeni]NYT54502.1 hypothetical protein [Eoetvoesiella caeni]RBP39309.1 hypothetical protein DFR37_105101 [Eoetvoesiella caeni]
MSTLPCAADNLAMTEYDAEALFDQAINLAYETFDDPTDGHITGVYAWLVWCAQRGAQADCVTVH